MDINQLKSRFAFYLRTIKGDEEIKYDPTSDISIFQYAKEFKQYIKSKYSSEEINLTSMSIGDILDLEVVNGKLVDPDKLAQEEQENNQETPIEGENAEEGTPIEDENNEEKIPIEGENADEATNSDKVPLDESSLTDILNSLMEDELFKGTIDTDQNGEFSNEELSNFFNAISIYDGDGENISLDDILTAAEEISNKTFPFNSPDTDSVDNLEENIPEIPNSSEGTQVKGASGLSGNSGNYSTPYVKSPSNTPNKPKTIDEMNAQELEAELTTANTDLAEKESNLEAIQNGTDEVVAPLKDAMENALNDYTEALENQNSQEAKELADVTKKIEEQETKQRENEELKQNCEDQIEIADKDIAHYDSVIQSCTDGISTLVTKIGDLQSQLNSVQDNSDDAAQYKAFIQAQIDQANIEKQKLEQEKQQAETAKGIAETKRDTAQQKLDNIENTITLTNEQIEELKSTQAELEEIVFKQNPELEQMKQNYLDAKDKYTTTRESEISRAKEEVKSAQDYVEKVSNKLTEVRKKDYEEDFSVVEFEDFKSKFNFENAVEWAKQFVGMSQSEMKAVFQQMGYPFHYDAWCGDFTRMVLLSQVGDNLADWFKNCSNLAFCPTIQTSGEGHEITDWNEARPGDIVLFDWADDGRDGSADHVGVVIGYDPETDTLITIEGNTTGSGGGSCVEIKHRKRSDIIGVYNTHKD